MDPINPVDGLRLHEFQTIGWNSSKMGLGDAECRARVTACSFSHCSYCGYCNMCCCHTWLWACFCTQTRGQNDHINLGKSHSGSKANIRGYQKSWFVGSSCFLWSVGTLQTDRPILSRRRSFEYTHINTRIWSAMFEGLPQARLTAAPGLPDSLMSVLRAWVDIRQV